MKNTLYSVLVPALTISIMLMASAAAQETIKVKTDYRVNKDYRKYMKTDVRIVGLAHRNAANLKFTEDQKSEFTFGGKKCGVEIADFKGEKPVVKIDFNANGDFEDDEIIKTYNENTRRGNSKNHGYIQSFFKREGRQYALIWVSYPQRANSYAMVSDVGSSHGKLSLPERNGEEKLDVDVILHDSLADGSFKDDKVLLDLDRNGVIASTSERVDVGETVLIGQSIVTIKSVDEQGLVVFEIDRRKDDSKGRDLLVELARTPLKGNQIPVFDFIDQNGKKVSSKDLQGKVVLIDFWGTW